MDFFQLNQALPHAVAINCSERQKEIYDSMSVGVDTGEAVQKAFDEFLARL